MTSQLLRYNQPRPPPDRGPPGAAGADQLRGQPGGGPGRDAGQSGGQVRSAFRCGLLRVLAVFSLVPQPQL